MFFSAHTCNDNMFFIHSVYFSCGNLDLISKYAVTIVVLYWMLMFGLRFSGKKWRWEGYGRRDFWYAILSGCLGAINSYVEGVPWYFRIFYGGSRLFGHPRVWLIFYSPYSDRHTRTTLGVCKGGSAGVQKGARKKFKYCHGGTPSL